jgi:hypothetical protein
LFSLLAVFVAAAAAWAIDVTPESRLKAAFISKVPQFVEWPAAPAAASNPPFTFCVAPPNPFGPALAELIAGETLNGRPYAIREVDRDDVLGSCHVLYVPANGRATLLARVENRPVLTIGEAAGFLDRGGMVLLRVASGRLQFEINIEPAQRAGLRISSQLLRLAVNVRGGGA